MLFSQVRKTGLAVSGEKAEKSRKVWTVKPPLMRRMPSERRGASAAPKRYWVAGDRSDGIETCGQASSVLRANWSQCDKISVAHLDDGDRRRLSKHVNEGDKHAVICEGRRRGGDQLTLDSWRRWLKSPRLRTETWSLETSPILPTRFELGREPGGLDSSRLEDLDDLFRD